MRKQNYSKLTQSTVCLLGKFAFLFVVCRFFFFQNQLFQKILSGIPLECRAVWIQIRPDILSGLIWIQTVCKDYLQTTLVDKEFMLQHGKEDAQSECNARWLIGDALIPWLYAGYPWKTGQFEHLVAFEEALNINGLRYTFSGVSAHYCPVSYLCQYVVLRIFWPSETEWTKEPLLG